MTFSEHSCKCGASSAVSLTGCEWAFSLPTASEELYASRPGGFSSEDCATARENHDCIPPHAAHSLQYQYGMWLRVSQRMHDTQEVKLARQAYGPASGRVSVASAPTPLSSSAWRTLRTSIADFQWKPARLVFHRRTTGHEWRT